MPTKIRLQRKGKKARPFYHIVIADGRAPRDGKYIERIGTYNPITQPADINLDFDRALYWVQTGAQPTDTVRNILSYTGVLYKHHLLKGVTKGALTEEQAEAKFDGWMKEKMEKISGEVKDIESSDREAQKSRMDAEKKVNEDRAEAIAKKRAAELKALEPAPVEEEAVAEVADAATTEETPATEAPAETPADEKKEEAAPAPVEDKAEVADATTAEKAPEATAETPAEEKKEEAAPAPVEEKKEEAPSEKAEEEKAKEPEAEEKPVEEAKEEPKAEEPKAEAKEEEKPAEEKSEEKKAE